MKLSGYKSELIFELAKVVGLSEEDTHFSANALFARKKEAPARMKYRRQPQPCSGDSLTNSILLVSIDSRNSRKKFAFIDAPVEVDRCESHISSVKRDLKLN